MLIIKDLHASIDNKKILNGINLSIKPGELHAVMGRNGSGKSTLANIIAGREDYDIESGSILFNGKDLLDQSPEDRALNGIFMSFQYQFWGVLASFWDAKMTPKSTKNQSQLGFRASLLRHRFLY